MTTKNTEKLLKVLEVVQNQTEKEAATREEMLVILDWGNNQEDDIPQNSNLGTAIKILMKKESNLFLAIERIDLDYLKIEEYKCFKVDDAMGTEDIYFVSPTETLYLESGCLDTF